MQLTEWTGGTEQLLDTPCWSSSVAGTNAIGIVVPGADHAVYVNGLSVLSDNDPHPIGYGGVGVSTIWETNGWFDDVVVRFGV